MTDDGRNIVLRLPRESRAKPADTRRRMATVDQRMSARARKMDDANGSVGRALGLSAPAHGAFVTAGGRRAQLAPTAAHPRTRLETLEETA